MRRFLLLIFITFSITFSLKADQYRFRVFLSDKPNMRFISPDSFLSEKSLQRRAKLDIPIDFNDYPIEQSYIDALVNDGFTIITKSKWMNTIVIESQEDKSLSLLRYQFIKKFQKVWYKKEETKVVQNNDYNDISLTSQNSVETDKYHQLKMHNAHMLHAEGYRGAGITIALIDAGFKNTDKIDVINKNIITYRDMIVPKASEFYSTNIHGTQVLSVLSYKDDGEFSGSAPDANYVLIRTEDDTSEFPIEEDYWIAGAEYADSLGVDIINSSLGYFHFDDSSMNYSHSDLDGKTAFISQGAGIASSRGILVFCSAGNEGMKLWKRINFPADNPDVVTVGSVNSDSLYSIFSGVGYVTENIVKPELVGMGRDTWICNENGNLVQGLGTSFSTPIICGLAACLMQAFPTLTPKEIKNLMIVNSSKFSKPDILIGYGIPNVFFKFPTELDDKPVSCPVEYNYKGDNLWNISIKENLENKFPVYVVSTSGQIVMKDIIFKGENELSLDTLTPGFYVINVLISEQKYPKLIRVEK